MTRATEVARGAIIESACEWVVTLDESPVSPGDRRRFADWLLESPIHVREYLAAQITWSLIAEVIQREDFVVDASNDAADRTIVPLKTAS